MRPVILATTNKRLQIVFGQNSSVVLRSKYCEYCCKRMHVQEQCVDYFNQTFYISIRKTYTCLCIHCRWTSSYHEGVGISLTGLAYPQVREIHILTMQDMTLLYSNKYFFINFNGN